MSLGDVLKSKVSTYNVNNQSETKTYRSTLKVPSPNQFDDAKSIVSQLLDIHNSRGDIKKRIEALKNSLFSQAEEEFKEFQANFKAIQKITKQHNYLKHKLDTENLYFSPVFHEVN